MNWRATGAAGFGGLLVLAFLLIIATPTTTAQPASTTGPYAGPFQPVILPASAPAEATPPDTAALAPSQAPFVDPGDGLPFASVRPSVHLPRVAAAVTPKPTPRSTPGPTPRPTLRPTPKPAALVVRVATSHSVSGFASWYCRAGVSACTSGYPDGPGADLYAAAGPSLRRAMCGSDTSNCWRGRIVTVNGLAIRLVDWCQCHTGQSDEKLLDLYYDAWTRIPNVSRGVVVRW